MKLTKDVESLNVLKNKEQDVDLLPDVKFSEIEEFQEIKKLRDNIFKQNKL